MSISRKLLLLFFVFSVGITATVLGVDLRWQYGGYSVTTKGEKLYSFYDTESVGVKPNGNIRVWVKAVTEVELEAVRKKNEKMLVEKGARRVVNHQYILFATYQNMDFKTMVEVIPYEEIANLPNVNIRMSLLFEIDCKEKKVRTLSITAYNKNGSPTSTSDEGKWDYIIPESNMDILRKMLCRQFH
jgi:hypothetical protein